MISENNQNQTTVPSSATVRQAAERMRKLNTHAIAVRGRANEVIGSLSAGDIVTRSTADGIHPDSAPVEQIMSTAKSDAARDTHAVGEFGSEHADRTRFGHAPDLRTAK